MTEALNPSLQNRWAIGPLVDFFEAHFDPPEPVRRDLERIRMAGRSFLVEDGTIGDRAADRAACMLGIHPSLIWPDWFTA